MYGPDRFRPMRGGSADTQWAAFRGDNREIPAIWDPAGETWRILSAIPRPPTVAAPPSYGDRAPVLPRSEWRVWEPPPEWVPILDQDGYNSCTGNAAAGALMQGFANSGIAVPTLSASYIYMHINGGHDDGAIISDTLAILQSRGTCTADRCPEDLIYLRQKPAVADQEAARYMVELSLTCKSFDEYASSIILFGSGPGAVMVGNGFNNLDSEGCPPVTPGPGNHAVRGYGLAKTRRGDWKIRMRNSWGTRWGNAGDFYITERHFDTIGYQDCYCVRAVVINPDLAQLPMPMGANPHLVSIRNEVHRQLARSDALESLRKPNPIA